eukprot:TRINITY_DN5539_c1_g1_i1.p1 TRINITY_DN5539_c1_g1~~TRINITY_DN5539_c1_g1_i1.p1  ORF type:complete len:249 (-),score=45.49 TRINITY_DN5539_c1_g1_i1:307-1053(-)
MQHCEEDSDSDMMIEITDEDIFSPSASASASESESELDMEYTRAFSFDSSHAESEPLPSFASVDALSGDEVEDGRLSYASSAEDDAYASNEAKTEKLLQLTARVLQEGTCNGELPMFERPLLMMKRDDLEGRALAREYIDMAATFSRALLHMETLQYSLPDACAQRVAQFFRPAITGREMRRSLSSHVPANFRSVCLDLDAREEVLPSKLMPAPERPRGRPWESVAHVLWCHAKWKRIFQRWALQEEA